MSYRKPIALLLTWIVLLFVAGRLVTDLRLLLDPPTLAYVLVIPLLAGLASAGPKGLFEALRDALSADAADLPELRRRGAASTLRSLGGAAVAAGMLGFFALLIASFNAMAMGGGQASSGQLLSSVPGMVLAPVYGLALKAFLFDALAESLEGSEPGIGADLG